MDKINKAAAAGVVFFAVILAGFVGIKVDQTTIALLGGAFVGLIVAIPTTAVIMMISLRRRDDAPAERQARYHSPMPQNPPQYWVMPQQPYVVRDPYPHAQQMQQPISAPEYMLPQSRRRFYMIGEGGEVKEIESPRDSDFDQPNSY